jgi:hypothetical protein
VLRAARVTLLPMRQRRLLAHALRLGSGARTGQRAHALASLAAADPTGFARDLVALLGRTALPTAGTVPEPADLRAAALLGVGFALTDDGEHGGDARSALVRALAGAGESLDPVTLEALEGAARELALTAAREACDPA